MIVPLRARTTVWTAVLLAVTGLAVTGLVVAATAGPVSAHTEVLRASPGPAEEVGGTVDAIELTFLDPVLDGVSIVVTGPSGAPVDGLAPAELAPDNRSGRAMFDPLTTDGDYRVEYEFSAMDGDRQQDRYRFTYRSTAGEGDGGDGLRPASVVGATAVGLCVLVAALAAVLAARRSRHAE